MSMSLFSARALADDIEIAQLNAKVGKLQQSIGELLQTVRTQSQRISDLEQEKQRLVDSAPKTTGLVSSSAESQSQFRPQMPSAASANPDIGLVGDFTFTSSQSPEDEEGNDRLSVREVELIIGHDVDPFTRFDSTITFSDFEDVAIEEAFVTYLSLPLDTKARIGRFRPKLSLASARHRDQLPTVDEPLMIQNYLGVEGLYKTGLELSNYLPLPWESVTHELIVGAIEGGIGEEGTLLGESRRRPSFYSRLRNFWEISDTADFELSTSFLKGSSDSDSKFEVNSFGVDSRFIQHFDHIQKLTLETEVIFQNRSEGYLEVGDDLVEGSTHASSGVEDSFRRSPWGMYALADYRVDQQWSAGLRWDYVQPVNYDTSFSRNATTGFAPYVTFFQSEFARWRLQYEHIHFAEEGHDNRFFLQGTFAIGTHKHALE